MRKPCFVLEAGQKVDKNLEKKRKKEKKGVGKNSPFADGLLIFLVLQLFLHFPKQSMRLNKQQRSLGENRTKFHSEVVDHLEGRALVLYAPPLHAQV